MWRKNRAKTYKDGCIGIDLNRNWNYQWGDVNSDYNPCSDSYRGPSPFSELEIKAIVQFIMDNLTKIKVSSSDINIIWYLCCFKIIDSFLWAHFECKYKSKIVFKKTIKYILSLL